MKIYKRYKFLREGLKSENGNLEWKIDKWNKAEGKLVMCSQGLHACKDPYDAFSYVQGEILALVECRGKHLTVGNKECWREQRVIKTYKWTKKDSLRLAIYSAELCLNIFEKMYPEDKRPREAIEAAKKVLFKDTAKNRSAADSTSSAAWSAESAARSAAWSAAWSAGSAAESAASSAAWSAGSAAESAASSAAWSAARSAADSTSSAAIKKIQKYFMKIVKEKMK
jgi:hypothetical protein